METKKKTKSTKKVILIVIAVVLAIALAVSIFLLVISCETIYFCFLMSCIVFTGLFQLSTRSRDSPF